MRKALVAGNWKMNGDSQFVSELVKGVANGVPDASTADVLICPPYVYLSQVNELTKSTPIQVGAQNVSDKANGAFTGEISLAMLCDLGCEYVILGHSERRSLYAESNDVVAEKFIATVNAGLKPILCVGESLQEREDGQTLNVVKAQITSVIDAAGIDKFANAVIAYEPVWAIGTGKTATAEQAQEVHAAIRQMIADACSQTASKIRILYGGSVNAANAAELFANKDVDGGLVGGASLKVDEFIAICQAAAV